MGIRSSGYFSFFWRNSPQGAMASSFTMFLDHTQRRITVGRTSLDEWSSRRRDLYLTTHNIHNRRTSMPPVGFDPTISAGGRPQTYTLDHAATGTGGPQLVRCSNSDVATKKAFCCCGEFVQFHADRFLESATICRNFINQGHSIKVYIFFAQPVSKMSLPQCFSTFVRPRPGKFFFQKTRARSQQI